VPRVSLRCVVVRLTLVWALACAVAASPARAHSFRTVSGCVASHYPFCPVQVSPSSSAMSAETSGELRRVDSSETAERAVTVRPAKRAYPSFGHGSGRVQPRRSLYFTRFPALILEGRSDGIVTAGLGSEVAPWRIQTNFN
jgi:hypothetical protein